jgi:hypothetical protein
VAKYKIISKFLKTSRAWWYIPVIPAFGRLRTVISRPTWAMKRDPISKNKINK